MRLCSMRSTSDGGASTLLASISCRTSCSRTPASASRSAAASRSFRTAARKASRGSKSPTSLANPSSSGGGRPTLPPVRREPPRPGRPPPLGLGVVVGIAHLGVYGLAGEERHDLLLDRRDRLSVTEHQRVGLRLLHHAVLDRRHLHPHHLARRRPGSFDREPRRPPLAPPPRPGGAPAARGPGARIQPAVPPRT